MGTLLARMLLVARRRGGVGQRHDRMAVLRRVLGELLAGQLSGAPALVEAMVENVPARGGGFDTGDDVQLGPPRVATTGAADGKR